MPLFRVKKPFNILFLLALFTPPPTHALSGNTQGKTVEKWTIYGSPQTDNPEISKLYQLGNGRKSPRLIALAQPITDRHILPYSNLAATQHSNTLNIIATPGETEPASLVLQTGTQAFNTVSISISDLLSKNTTQIIAAENIDLRLVKPWFQSATAMRRTNRNQPKKLVPELLLHDNQLVKVDYTNQTNAIRMNPGISDAPSLQPFSLPAKTNQQIWLTAHIPNTARAGEYLGTITVKANQSSPTPFTSTISIKLTILPFKLAETSLFMGQFYLAWLSDAPKTYYNARGKNPRQMLAELTDMKQHGVNQVTIDHNFRRDPEAKTLSKQIALVKKAGLTTRPIIYVDWHVARHENAESYRNKLEIIKKTFKNMGIDDFWIYNKDEKKLSDLIRSLHTFTSTHQIGSKNIVAVTRPRIALKLAGNLDYALMQHKTPTSTIKQLKAAGITPIAYGLPHAGEEKPSTTRYTYGLGLVEKGFAGTLSYAYQSGETWDDWMHWQKSNYRPNVMAYPTDSAPIPTLQWEAWREAVDDLRYLETYAQLAGKSLTEALAEAQTMTKKAADNIRQYLIQQILNNQQKQRLE